jgi:hypothetical protein
MGLYTAAAAMLLAMPVAYGQDATSTNSTGPVTRQEFDQLKKDNSDLKLELNAVKQQQADQAKNADQDAKDNEDALKAINDQLAKVHLGFDTVVIAGDAAINFVNQRGTDSTFSAGISPLILWTPAPHILVESAFSFGVGTDFTNTSSTSVDLGLANISFELCDECVVGAGLFTTPFGAYHNHFDPPWINKFADDPLVWSDGIGPTTNTGLFVRGAIPISTSKFTYDVYVSNGPNLVINPNSGTVGTLNFDEFTDLNNGKAVGGRVAFIPHPSLEIGYSCEFAQTSPDGFPHADLLLQAVDMNYKKEWSQLAGTLQVQAQWLWSNVEPVTYDPSGSLGVGPLNFKNHRNGGYVLAEYRPTLVDNPILKNVELAARYDWVFVPLAAPGGGNEERLTLGIDYWITNYIVVQTEYEIDKRQGTAGQNAFIAQLGIGL